MKSTYTKTSVIFLAVIALMLLLAVIRASVAGRNRNGAERAAGQSGAAQAVDRPMIIWFHAFETDPELLRLAISGGIFSHVMFRGLHEFDRPEEVIFAHPNLKKVLTLCKDNGVEVIWLRFLYPGYRFRGITTFRSICDASYYAQRIRQVKKEGKRMGVSLVALDAEPYGQSPLKPLKMPKTYKLTPEQYNALNNAVQTGVRAAGKVDFVLPAVSPYSRHLYNATPALGKLVISEHTYRDIPWKLKDKRRPFDVFGAYISIKKDNPTHPDGPGPFFTPREILARQDLWAQKKGLFIFPGYGDRLVEVVHEFSKIGKVRPVRDSNDIP